MTRPRLLVAVLACAAAASLPSWAAPGPRCDAVFVPGVGRACRMPGGALAVYSNAGKLLGTTHEPVDAAPAPATSSPAAVTPACAPPTSGDKHFVAIYARASDDSDAYSSLAGSIRSLMAGVNGYVRDAAAAGGDVADLKFQCSSGSVEVKHEVLSTKRSSATFSTIVADLQARGYTDVRAKYAVFYDDTGICSCAGQGMFVEDESPSASNGNNGNAGGPLFAVDYGRLEARVMAHEMMHTMGAIGNSAPHTTGAHHCTDGLDVMCYNDGGPKGVLYSASSCAAEVLDCKKDDYFSSRPAEGSYLATHWNIASRANSYVAFPPLMTELTCPATAGVGKAIYCAFNAADSSSGIYYTVVWGDGAVTRVPSSGTVAPGVRQVAGHTYTKLGSFLLRVTATSTRTSALKDLWVRVVSDTVPPSLAVADPVPGAIYAGCATSVPTAGVGEPIIVQRACVRVAVSDAGSGINHVSVYLGRSHEGTRYSAPWAFEFPVNSAGTDMPVRIEAWDNAGNVTAKTILVTAI